MIPKLRPHLTYANVVSSICLFVALGGGAYAAVALPKNSVDSEQLKKNAVISKKIKNGAVTSDDVKNGSVTSTDIKDESVSSTDVKNSSLLAKDFEAGQLPAGPKGDTGPRGPQGPAGDTQRIPGTVTFTSGMTTVPAGEFRQITVECKPFDGFLTQLTGGGWMFGSGGSAEVHVLTSRPDVITYLSGVGGPPPIMHFPPEDGGSASGWAVDVLNSGKSEAQVAAYAACLRRDPGVG